MELDKSDNYSDLKYLQCNGKINHIRHPQKHRGIVNTNNSTTENTTEETATASTSSSSLKVTSNGWDRDVCLKISYRIRHSDSFVQFALIIYEPLMKNPRSQRNLLREFQKVSSDRKILFSSKKESNQKSEQKPSTSLTKKSLRF